jgi:adenylate cyclase
VRPIKDDSGVTVGVFGCDLVLTHISQFMRELEVGKSGKTFIIERNGLLVASSSTAEPVLKMGDEVRRISAGDFEDPMIRAAAQFIEGTFGSYSGVEDSEQLTFDFEGEPILMQVSLVKHPLGIKWLSVVMIPESDFMGSIRENTRTTLGLFVVLVLLATVTILITARLITRSIQDLSQEMYQIADFNVSDESATNSTLIEIRNMQQSMNTMKNALRSFGKYVPSDVVRQLIRAKKEVRLGVETAEVTIFFSDVAGFTSIAENLSNDELVAMMGEYLEELSQLIMASGGTVDKYIGDAIMAFWNAPQPVPDHTVRAVQTALQCTRRLQELNSKWQQTGRPELQTRIGIHTGSALVGNFGSHRRMNYTVLGDSVNLAARLEGLNKRYGTRIIISQLAYERVKSEFLCRPLDTVMVVGRTIPTQIYEVIMASSEASAEDKNRVTQYSTALDAYLRKEFQQAESILQDYLRQNPGEAAATMLLARCQHLISDLPGEEWSGAVPLTEK